MIRSFRHKGVERFFKSGSRAGIQAAHAPRLARQLSALDAATRPEDMNRPGWDWHPLKGGLSGHWSVSVNGNWRLTFAFLNGDALPPEISHMTLWSPITPERKLDDEKAIYRGADHWLPA